MADILVYDPRTQQVTTVQHQPVQPMPRYTIDTTSNMWTGVTTPAAPSPAISAAPANAQPAWQPEQPRPLIDFSHMPQPYWDNMRGLRFRPAGPQQPAAPASPPAPPPDFGTPQIPADEQQALTQL